MNWIKRKIGRFILGCLTAAGWTDYGKITISIEATPPSAEKWAKFITQKASDQQAVPSYGRLNL